jgi:hypothetical protein
MVSRTGTSRTQVPSRPTHEDDDSDADPLGDCDRVDESRICAPAADRRDDDGDDEHGGHEAADAADAAEAPAVRRPVM